MRRNTLQQVLSSIIKRHYDVDAATKTGLRLTLAAPHQIFAKDSLVKQVNLSTEEGDVGVLAGHLPMVLQLRPGLIEIIPEDGGGGSSSRYFASGGFATVNPDSSLQVGAMEAVPLEQLDDNRVMQGLAEAERMVQAARTPEDQAEADIHLQVYKAMAGALTKHGGVTGSRDAK